MADTSLHGRADVRFEQALAKSGARDPREHYRSLLRDLRQRNEQGFQRALHYFETRLLPRLVDADSDPLAEWLEYGRMLAAALSPGRTIQIDTTGRAHDYQRPVAADALVLHLPAAPSDRALVVGIPPTLSPAQRATYELLVAGKQQ